MTARTRCLVMLFAALAATTSEAQQPSPTGKPYQVVKVCPLVSLAEVKKLAPWAPHMDQFAAAEEEPLGSYGSSCHYPTVIAQVMPFGRQTIESANKVRKLEPVNGIGDEAWVSNNRERYAELYARVGPHLLTLQLDIATGQTFEAAKPTLTALGKLFVSKLRGQ